MAILDRRLNDKGRNWRHVYKSLIVLDYLLLAGSEQIVVHLKEQIYIIKTLLHFQYIDDLGRDHGSCVRQKTKDLLALIEDPDQVVSRRNNPQLMDAHGFLAYNEEKYNSGGRTSFSWSSSAGSRHHAGSSSSSASSTHQPHAATEEDIQLQMALDASRQQAMLDAQKRTSRLSHDEGDLELQAALKISAAEASKHFSKKSSEDLIDLFQGPPAASEAHRELAMLSTQPQPQACYHHSSSYEFGGYPHPNEYPANPVYSPSANTCRSFGSPTDNERTYGTSSGENRGGSGHDPFAGLSDDFHFSDGEAARLRHVSSSASKPAAYGSIPPNSVPTPFEVAAIAKDEKGNKLV